MYYYDLLEPSQDTQASLNELADNFAPLYTQAWINHKGPQRNNPRFDMNVNTFINMWMNKVMKIIVAYDDKQKLVGYLLGMVFRPMTYNATVFHIEDWYGGGNDELERGLFKYLIDSIRMLGVDEIWINHLQNEQPPVEFTHWKKSHVVITDVYRKA